MDELGAGVCTDVIESASVGSLTDSTDILSHGITRHIKGAMCILT